jgi:hypothetical protein
VEQASALSIIICVSGNLLLQSSTFFQLSVSSGVITAENLTLYELQNCSFSEIDASSSVFITADSRIALQDMELVNILATSTDEGSYNLFSFLTSEDVQILRLVGTGISGFNRLIAAEVGNFTGESWLLDNVTMVEGILGLYSTNNLVQANIQNCQISRSAAQFLLSTTHFSQVLVRNWTVSFSVFGNLLGQPEVGSFVMEDSRFDHLVLDSLISLDAVTNFEVSNSTFTNSVLSDPNIALILIDAGQALTCFLTDLTVMNNSASK